MPDALRLLNNALLIGLGASLVVIAPELRARFAPHQPIVKKASSTPPLSKAPETPRFPELSLETPLHAGDSVAQVIMNNRGGLQSCYLRARLRGDSIDRGKVTIKVTIAFSGFVQHTKIDAPPGSRAIEPCFREVLSRWAFPAARKGYATEFTMLVPGPEDR
jgi:hypothetical protein